MKLLPFLAFLVSAAVVGFANQERLIPLSGFRLEAAGGFIVEGKQNDQGDIVALSIVAFGSKHTAAMSVLEQLRGCHANGIRVVSDVGIVGRFVHVQFESGFVSYTKALRVLTVSAGGEFRVQDIPVRKDT